jgi:multiple sugar transport system substrate-binding protein
VRRWHMFLCGLAAATALVAAGCGEDESTTTSAGSTPPPNEPVTITIRHPWTGDEKKLFEQALRAFEDKNPNITVKPIGFADPDTFDQQVVIKTINGGNPPDAFLSFGPDYVGQYCASDLWQDLTPYMERDGIDIGAFADAAVTYTSFDGKQCALPSLTDAYGLYYNKKLFRQAGLTEPPKTMTELAEYAKKLTVRNPDGSIKIAGFVPLDGWGQLGISDLARGWGAQWFDDEGNPQIASDPGWAAALEWEKALIDWYGYDDITRFFAAYNDAEFSASNAFETGKVAMMFDGEWRTAFIRREHPELDYATAPMPVADDQADLYGSVRVGGTIVGVPRGAPNEDAGWLLVKYLATDPEYLVFMANNVGNVPTTTQSENAPDLELDERFQTFIDVWNNEQSSFSPPLNASGAGYADQLTSFVKKWEAGDVSDLQAGLAEVDQRISDQLALGEAP